MFSEGVRKLISLCLLASFSVSIVVTPQPAYAQSVIPASARGGSVFGGKTGIQSLPEPGTMVNLSPAFKPLMIKGLKVHPENPLRFDFLVDTGDDKSDIKQQSQRLINYFLACLTIPEDDLWVNLSPYEKDRMIPESLGKTELGRDLLAQDYILKQLTASMIYPEDKLGKVFWDRVYAKAQQLYGTSEIPVNTFNKVWILADTAKVFESNNTAYVVNAHLKVMLDEDYTAMTKNLSSPNVLVGDPDKAHTVASQIIKEIILPEIEKEINTGKNFATIRQIFHAFILAAWYKKNLKQAILNQVYSDKGKVKGLSFPHLPAGRQVLVRNPQQEQPLTPDAIYQRYLTAYKKGVFNYIKDPDPTNVGSGVTSLPRKYFSGGTKFLSTAMTTIKNAKELSAFDSAAMASTNYMIKADMAMAESSVAVPDEVLDGLYFTTNLLHGWSHEFAFMAGEIVLSWEEAGEKGELVIQERDGQFEALVDSMPVPLKNIHSDRFKISVSNEIFQPDKKIVSIQNKGFKVLRVRYQTGVNPHLTKDPKEFVELGRLIDEVFEAMVPLRAMTDTRNASIVRPLVGKISLLDRTYRTGQDYQEMLRLWDRLIRDLSALPEDLLDVKGEVEHLCQIVRGNDTPIRKILSKLAGFREAPKSQSFIASSAMTARELYDQVSALNKELVQAYDAAGLRQPNPWHLIMPHVIRNGLQEFNTIFSLRTKKNYAPGHTRDILQAFDNLMLFLDDEKGQQYRQAWVANFNHGLLKGMEGEELYAYIQAHPATWWQELNTILKPFIDKYKEKREALYLLVKQSEELSGETPDEIAKGKNQSHTKRYFPSYAMIAAKYLLNEARVGLWGVSVMDEKYLGYDASFDEFYGYSQGDLEGALGRLVDAQWSWFDVQIAVQRDPQERFRIFKDAVIKDKEIRQKALDIYAKARQSSPGFVSKRAKTSGGRGQEHLAQDVVDAQDMLALIKVLIDPRREQDVRTVEEQAITVNVTMQRVQGEMLLGLMTTDPKQLARHLMKAMGLKEKEVLYIEGRGTKGLQRIYLKDDVREISWKGGSGIEIGLNDKTKIVVKYIRTYDKTMVFLIDFNATTGANLKLKGQEWAKEFLRMITGKDFKIKEIKANKVDSGIILEQVSAAMSVDLETWKKELGAKFELKALESIKGFAFKEGALSLQDQYHIIRAVEMMLNLRKKFTAEELQEAKNRLKALLEGENLSLAVAAGIVVRKYRSIEGLDELKRSADERINDWVHNVYFQKKLSAVGDPQLLIFIAQGVMQKLDDMIKDDFIRDIIDSLHVQDATYYQQHSVAYWKVMTYINSRLNSSIKGWEEISEAFTRLMSALADQVSQVLQTRELYNDDAVIDEQCLLPAFVLTQDAYDHELRLKDVFRKNMSSLIEIGLSEAASASVRMVLLTVMVESIYAPVKIRVPLGMSVTGNNTTFLSQAMITKPSKTGGIDLKAQDLMMDIEHQDAGVAMSIDPTLLAQFQSSDFAGIEARIIDITPINGALSIMGLER